MFAFFETHNISTIIFYMEVPEMGRTPFHHPLQNKKIRYKPSIFGHLHVRKPLLFHGKNPSFSSVSTQPAYDNLHPVLGEHRRQQLLLRENRQARGAGRSARPGTQRKINIDIYVHIRISHELNRYMKKYIYIYIHTHR